MKRFLFLFFTTLIIQCSSDFEPKFYGKTIYHDWNADKIQLNLDGQTKEIRLPTADTLDFNNPIWLKAQDRFLMTTSEKGRNCYSYSIVSFDTNGTLKDTIFTPTPCTIIDFMPSPDDNLLLIRSYKYSDLERTMTGPVRYFIYDLKTKTMSDEMRRAMKCDVLELA